MVGVRSVEIQKDAIRQQMIRIFRSLGALELENTQELLWTVYLDPLQFQRDDYKEFFFLCVFFFEQSHLNVIFILHWGVWVIVF